MAQSDATAVSRATSKRRRRIIIAGALVALLLFAYIGISAVQYQRSRAAALREAGAFAALRTLGAQYQEQLTQEFVPFGRILPGSAGARYGLVIKLRNPAASDADLALLDRFDRKRIAALDLLNCRVGDATLARAARFPHLVLLGLGQARNSKAEPWPATPTGRFTGAGFAHLDRLRELETVGLHGPDITDEALAHLKGASKLRVLILYGSRVTGAGLAALGPKPALVTLKLGGTRIGDGDLAVLEQFSSLETLDLIDTAVTDAGLPQLKKLTHLKQLLLSGCKVSDAAVAALLQARPGLAVQHPATKPGEGTRANP